MEMENQNREEGRSGGNMEVSLLTDRLRISVIKVAEHETQKNGISVSPIVMSALADLTFKFIEQLAKDLEKFAQHAGRKSVNMDDVILAAHRNEEVTTILKSFSQELLKEKEQLGEKKRKKTSAKGERIISD